MSVRFAMNFVRAFAVLALFTAPFAFAQQQDPNQNPNWLAVKKMMFGDREVHANAEDVIKLWLPARAEDAGIVPVLIRTKVDQTPERYIKNVWVVIDNNPSPVGVKFTMTPDSGRADIETRVRVETYTPVRAVAQMNDGSVWMSTSTIIAAGGCSSPGPKLASELAKTGKMKFKVDDVIEPDKPAMAQLMIHHPNFSGLALDGREAYFVKEVKVFYGDKMVMQADIDFTISENPNFRFYFKPQDKAELRAEIVDSKDLRFEHKVAVTSPLLEKKKLANE
jgi:sulfur-oxidizing protein SoxY